ncbi:hypothetical protein AVEN_183994-1 [Araneus ventricosus]|uniref:Transmembrane protein 53 n=1 Tax=Araneus ventricosus TaxID=182803 RepID=A0A4Y2E2P2_ARAVE|nr:hypothetical protein AVEN_183994-1 [Araneus ventricosus]
MPIFVHQFRIISSLKNTYNVYAVPFHKVIAPVLSRHLAVRKMHTQSINKTLQLKSVDEIQNDSSKKKPLALILAWMLAKETHLEKFRKLYISRGFDVLTVNTAPKDLLFPVSGSQVIAKNVLDYFTSHETYEDIVVHAFSVGCYLMGEMFVQMRKDSEKYKDISSRIRSVILDSFVDFEGIQIGFSRAVTKYPITIKILEWYVSIHLALMFNVATKHYLTSSKNFHKTPLKCPALVFVSEADKVGSLVGNQMLIDNWQAMGVDVKMKCWKDSKHVSHWHKYQDEYVAEVDKFLSKNSNEKGTIEHLEQKARQKRGIKFYRNVKIRFVRYITETENEYCHSIFRSKSETCLLDESSKEKVKMGFEKIKTSCYEFKTRGRGWAIGESLYLEVNTCVYRPLAE